MGVDEVTAKNDSCQMEHLMSQQTSEKFFSFMKTLADGRDKPNEKGQNQDFHFKTTLDFSSYTNLADFIHHQKGDSHLQNK